MTLWTLKNQNNVYISHIYLNPLNGILNMER